MFRFKLFRSGVCVVLLVSGFISSAAAQYILRDLGTLGTDKNNPGLVWSVSTGINNLGQVTGYSYDPAAGTDRAFVYSNGVMTSLGSWRYSISTGINDSGQLSGYGVPTQQYELDNGANVTAFISTAGVMTDLGTLLEPLARVTSVGNGINNSGQVAGYSNAGPGCGSGSACVTHAFISTAGVMTDLGPLGGPVPGPYQNSSVAMAINNYGHVVGESQTGDPIAGAHRAFEYSNGAMKDLGVLAGNISAALAINDAGQIVGFSSTTDDFADYVNIAGAGYPRFYHAFLYSAGTMTDIGTLGGQVSFATGINSSGDVVGWSTLAGDDAWSYFLYTNDTGMVDLNSLLPLGSRWDAWSAITFGPDINDSGQITGTGYIDGTYHAFLMSPSNVSGVPEPPIIGLLLAGLVAMGLVARNRGTQAVAVTSMPPAAFVARSGPI